MNKKFLKAVSLLLVALLLLPFAVSCNKGDEGEGEGGGTTVTTAGGEASQYRDDLPTLDFDGEIVTFVSRDAEWTKSEVTVVSEDTSDIVNEAVYNREKDVENRLNIDLVNVMITEGEDWDTALYIIVDAVKTDILSGSNEYDIGVCNATQFYANVAENIAYDLYDVPHVDLEKSYYSQLLIEKSEVNGAIFGVSGDASMTLIQKSLVTYFNKKMVNEQKIPDLYETVKKGDWTFEYQKQLATQIFISDDETPDETDTYGFVSDAREGVDAYLSGWDIQMVTRDADGKFTLDNLDRSKFQAALARINESYYQTEGIFALNHQEHEDPYESKEIMFANDQAMFATLKLGACQGDHLRLMESEYGILPIPKYDAQQTGYYTSVEDLYSVYFVSTAVPEERIDIVGATLECFFSESDDVRYNLFEVALKVKYQSDSSAGQMLDIIIDNVKIDSAYVFAGITSGLGCMLRDLVERKSNDFASFYRTKKLQAEKGFEKFYDKLEMNGL